MGAAIQCWLKAGTRRRTGESEMLPSLVYGAETGAVAALSRDKAEVRSGIHLSTIWHQT
jgi:hypothetical protein